MPTSRHERPDHHAGRYYHLTHDYLVPSLREWLTRKERETIGGRTAIRLAERTAEWTARRYQPLLARVVGVAGDHALYSAVAPVTCREAVGRCRHSLPRGPRGPFSGGRRARKLFRGGPIGCPEGKGGRARARECRRAQRPQGDREHRSLSTMGRAVAAANHCQRHDGAAPERPRASGSLARRPLAGRYATRAD